MDSHAQQWLDLSWFGFSADTGPTAIITLEGTLRRGQRPPRTFVLAVRRGSTVTTHTALSSATSRLNRTRRPRRAPDLKWTASFEVPPAIAGDPRASFELLSAERTALSLPDPVQAPTENRVLAELRAPRIGTVLIASATALLAGLGPVPALADGSSTDPTTTVLSTTPTTGTTDTTTTPTTDTTSTTTTSTGTTSTTTPTTTTATSTTGTTSTTTTTSGTGKGSTDGAKHRRTHSSTGHRTHKKTTSSTHHGSAQHHARAHHHGSSHHRHSSKVKHHASGGAGLAGKHEHHHTVTSLSTVPTGPSTVTSTTPWGMPVTADPFNSAQLRQYAALVGKVGRPPIYLQKIYRAAARRYHLPWQLLAAINYVETGYGRDLAVSSAGAEGWMQFMPSTWAQYGVSVTSTGKPRPGIPNPWDPADAIFAAARYLTAAGAKTNLARAVFAYNHAGWYVQEVLSIAEMVNRHAMWPQRHASRKIAAMLTMARLLNGMPYVWGGGHANFSMVTPGYDCSGFVSAVLHAGGYLNVPVTTQTLPGQSLIRSGPGRYVTIYDRTYLSADQDHVIVHIKKQWWESGGWGVQSDQVHRMSNVSAAYLKSFNLVLHPRGL